LPAHFAFGAGKRGSVLKANIGTVQAERQA
jgi:hypothetical protein